MWLVIIYFHSGIFHPVINCSSNYVPFQYDRTLDSPVLYLTHPVLARGVWLVGYPSDGGSSVHIVLLQFLTSLERERSLACL